MAEQIAQDPSFAQMAQAMQANMGAMMGGAAPPEAPTSTRSAAAEEPAMPGGMPGMPGMPGMDPSAYANMMSGVLQNPQFVEMAEKLGQQIMQVPCPHGLTSFVMYFRPNLIGSLIAYTLFAITATTHHSCPQAISTVGSHAEQPKLSIHILSSLSMYVSGHLQHSNISFCGCNSKTHRWPISCKA